MASVIFRRDATWRRLDPTTVLAGSPLTLFRVTASGAAVLDALDAGGDLPSGHRPLTERMVAAGAIHPLPVVASLAPDTTVASPTDDETVPRAPDTTAASPTHGEPGPALGDVTVVVPTHGEPAATIAALVQHLGPVGRVVVVDDAAPVPLAPLDGAEVLRLPLNVGPGAARNAALERVETPLVLFVDADARIARDAVQMLLGHLADEHVVAVAPRVCTPVGHRVVERYEAVRSPLDMGAEPALVRPGTRVGYVPTAVLLCRTAALRAIGGFDPGLRYGEDVDLVWRLVEAGGRCRYEPAATATHAARRSLPAWMRQRVAYGSAAAPLDRRHPGAVAPARLPKWSAAAWAVAATGHLLAGAALGTVSSVRLARMLTRAAVRRPDALRIGATTTARAGAQLADATISCWLPIALGAAVVSRPLRPAIVAAAVVPAVVEWSARRPRLDPLRYAALRTLDRAAYGAGVWRGVLAERRPGPLLPHLD